MRPVPRLERFNHQLVTSQTNLSQANPSQANLETAPGTTLRSPSGVDYFAAPHCSGPDDPISLPDPKKSGRFNF